MTTKTKHYAYFDRFDICEAYYALENDFNRSGWLQERPSNQQRSEATHVQLDRIRFRPRPSLSSFHHLEENARAIYLNAAHRFGLPLPKGQKGGLFA